MLADAGIVVMFVAAIWLLVILPASDSDEEEPLNYARHNERLIADLKRTKDD